MMFKVEKQFINHLYEHEEKFMTAGPSAVMEGFQYFSTPEYLKKPDAVKNRISRMLRIQGIMDMLKLGQKFIRLLPSIKKNISRNYLDMGAYLKAINNGQLVPTTPAALIGSFPNIQLWKELETYAWEKHHLIMGFTELPREYVFEGKAVPFRYALVFAQEMQKEPIETAPKLDAGIEVITVYNSLGIATNDIARWLRDKYSIVCMAIHPLGGLVDNIPLAAKAGLGAIGHHGLLITKEFGPRCRISPLFLDAQLFNYTDSAEHEWIHAFCNKCGTCERSCPTQAIFTEPKLSKKYHNTDIPDRYESFDREKCFTSFAVTMGCSVCISVCPFSRRPDNYDRMKKTIKKRER